MILPPAACFSSYWRKTSIICTRWHLCIIQRKQSATARPLKEQEELLKKEKDEKLQEEFESLRQEKEEEAARQKENDYNSYDEYGSIETTAPSSTEPTRVELTEEEEAEIRREVEYQYNEQLRYLRMNFEDKYREAKNCAFRACQSPLPFGQPQNRRDLHQFGRKDRP